MIPNTVYKSMDKDLWESKIIDKWKELSEQIETKEEARKEFLLLISKNKYYGVNQFWVENYKYNSQSWLKSNMWIGVKYDSIIFYEEKSK